MSVAFFGEIGVVFFVSGVAAVSSALLLGFACGFFWATRRQRRVPPLAPVPPARLSPPRNRARSPQPYSWVPEPPPLPSAAEPRRRGSRAKATSPVRGQSQHPPCYEFSRSGEPRQVSAEVPFTPRVAGRWRQVLEGVFFNLDLQELATSNYRKARAIQNQWSSWTRYRNRLAADPWERLRGPCGCKGRQPEDRVAPGPSARGRTPF